MSTSLIYLTSSRFFHDLLLWQAPNDGFRNEGLIPQLFTSVPALNEAASYLSQTTSYLTRCFTESARQFLFFTFHCSDYYRFGKPFHHARFLSCFRCIYFVLFILHAFIAEEPMSRVNAQELATLSFGTSRSSSTDGESSYGRCSTNSLTTTAAPSVHDVPIRGSPTHTSEETTQNTVSTQTGFNGLSMFQGYVDSDLRFSIMPE